MPLARAIAPRPSVLLMDEPFSGLDPRLREKMREETLAILHETRATSIIVTHDAEEAMRMGDRVALMRAGAIVQTGTALDLYRAPKDILAARTFSDLNELPARVEQGNAANPLGGFFANGLHDGADAIVCVRRRRVRLLPLCRASLRARCALPRRCRPGRACRAGTRRPDSRPRAGKRCAAARRGDRRFHRYRRGSGIRGEKTGRGPLDNKLERGLRRGRLYCHSALNSKRARGPRVGDRKWD